jgi:hypothetical protein
MSLQTQHNPKYEAEITYWNSAGGRVAVLIGGLPRGPQWVR